MLPPDFYERKAALIRKSERMRVLNHLREHGLDPDSFPHRFMTDAEEATLLATERPGMKMNCPLVERVTGWDAVKEQIIRWADRQPEVAIWYDAGPGNGGLVLPGEVIARHLDELVAAVHQRGNVMLATPDCRAGCVYFEEEYENHFAFWGEA